MSRKPPEDVVSDACNKAAAEVFCGTWKPGPDGFYDACRDAICGIETALRCYEQSQQGEGREFLNEAEECLRRAIAKASR